MKINKEVQARDDEPGLGPGGGRKKWLESVFFSIRHADELGACVRDKSSSEGVTGVWSSGEMSGCVNLGAFITQKYLNPWSWVRSTMTRAWDKKSQGFWDLAKGVRRTQHRR